MGVKQGCLKPALFGCLGLLSIVIVMVVVSGVLAWRSAGQQQIADRELVAGDTAAPVDAADLADLTRRPGRVELMLSAGEFRIKPGQPGTGVVVKARFDESTHQLVDALTIEPDSTWVYRVEYRQTISPLQAVMRAIFADAADSRVDVYLPPDVPIELVVDVAQGGGEMDLGGLWLADTSIQVRQGGFELDVSEPLREPIGSLVLQSSMGGFEAANLGNASPMRLEIDCRMGGGEIDLRGAWRNGADISAKVSMGGMELRVPRDMPVEGVAVSGGASDELTPANPEIPVPTLRFVVEQSMGEVAVVRR